MKVRSADLSTLWEGIVSRYEAEGRPLPRAWQQVYSAMWRVLAWGARR